MNLAVKRKKMYIDIGMHIFFWSQWVDYVSKEKKRVIFLFSKLVRDITLEKSVNHNYTAHIAVERIKKKNNNDDDI